jgi:hypothetical protein
MIACVEGMLPEPIRCWVYGDGFCSIDGKIAMSAAARKQKIIVPTLEERVRALMQEFDETLDALAEERRPKGEDKAIPAPCMRQALDIKGGHCLYRSYLAAIKEPN